ncbi:hypothetical protein RFI_20352, partial [Reticulomyxa filosa]
KKKKVIKTHTYTIFMTQQPNKKEHWEKRIDPDGKEYYLDTSTDEMYRVERSTSGFSHTRIKTDERMSIITRDSAATTKEEEEEEEENKAKAKHEMVPSMGTVEEETETNDHNNDNDNDNYNYNYNDNNDSDSPHENDDGAHLLWVCRTCNYENPISDETCSSCNEPKPSDATVVTHTSVKSSNLNRLSEIMED